MCHKVTYKLFGFLEFVNESYEVNEKEKWMQKAFSKNKGKLHKKLKVAADEKIPASKINKRLKNLKKKEHKTAAELKLQKELVLAKTASKINKK